MENPSIHSFSRSHPRSSSPSYLAPSPPQSQYIQSQSISPHSSPHGFIPNILPMYYCIVPQPAPLYPVASPAVYQQPLPYNPLMPCDPLSLYTQRSHLSRPLSPRIHGPREHQSNYRRFQPSPLDIEQINSVYNQPGTVRKHSSDLDGFLSTDKSLGRINTCQSDFQSMASRQDINLAKRTPALMKSFASSQHNPVITITDPNDSNSDSNEDSSIFVTSEQLRRDELLQQFRNTCQLNQEYIQRLTIQSSLLKTHIKQYEESLMKADGSQQPRSTKNKNTIKQKTFFSNSLKSNLENYEEVLKGSLDSEGQSLRSQNYQKVPGPLTGLSRPEIVTQHPETQEQTSKKAEEVSDTKSDIFLELVQSQELLTELERKRSQEEEQTISTIVSLLKVNQQNRVTLKRLRAQNDEMRELIIGYEKIIESLQAQKSDKSAGVPDVKRSRTSFEAEIDRIQAQLQKEKEATLLMQAQVDRAAHEAASMKSTIKEQKEIISLLLEQMVRPYVQQDIAEEVLTPFKIEGLIEQQKQGLIQYIDSTISQELSALRVKVSQLEELNFQIPSLKSDIFAKGTRIEQLEKQQEKNVQRLKQLSYENTQLRRLNDQFKQFAKAAATFKTSSKSNPNIGSGISVKNQEFDRKISLLVEPNGTLLSELQEKSRQQLESQILSVLKEPAVPQRFNLEQKFA